MVGEKKTARDGTQGKKRADLLLVRNRQGRDPRTQEEKSGPTAGKRAKPTAGKNLCEDWLRKEEREPMDAREWHTRAMRCIRWGKKVKFFAAEALRGVNSTIFDAQGAGSTMSWASGTT